MSSRRRRRDRRAHRTDHPEPPVARPQVAKGVQKRRAAFEARMTRVRRMRSVVGLLGFVPLGASLLCGSGADIIGLCGISREIYLGVWAAIFGTFLGLSFRLWRERRDFERAGSAA